MYIKVADKNDNDINIGDTVTDDLGLKLIVRRIIIDGSGVYVSDENLKAHAERCEKVEEDSWDNVYTSILIAISDKRVRESIIDRIEELRGE